MPFTQAGLTITFTKNSYAKHTMLDDIRGVDDISFIETAELPADLLNGDVVKN